MALVPQMLAGLLCPVNNTRYRTSVTTCLQRIEKNNVSCMRNLQSNLWSSFDLNKTIQLRRFYRDDQSNPGKTWSGGGLKRETANDATLNIASGKVHGNMQNFKNMFSTGMKNDKRYLSFKPRVRYDLNA